MAEDTEVDLVFRLQGADRDLEDEIVAAFPDGLVSPADNFLGGLEIAVILKPAKEIIESILGFASRWRDRYKDATIEIDGKAIKLSGYGPGDALKILRAAGLVEAGPVGGLEAGGEKGRA